MCGSKCRTQPSCPWLRVELAAPGVPMPTVCQKARTAFERGFLKGSLYRQIELSGRPKPTDDCGEEARPRKLSRLLGPILLARTHSLTSLRLQANYLSGHAVRS